MVNDQTEQPGAPSADASPLLRAGWRLDNSFARLPGTFHSRVNPTPVAAPELVLLNQPLARFLGLDPDMLRHPEAAKIFAGNQVPPGAMPIAQAYAGHQFGNLTRLGDGRATLLGEQLTPAGARFDIQWKGAGPTPYSRRGDGRAALGPMLREYIISEAMHALGIPTTRSLAVAATGEPVYRERPLPGAVLTRVAASHIRVGTFEYFAATGDFDSLRALTHYTIERHFPNRAESENPALGLLEDVMERQASLIAQWMRVGFVHGVMNTDNMALSGETIDYGPCAFIDAYDPSAVFSSIDHDSRYAFGQQPGIAAWNLTRFAEALLPVLHPETERAVTLANDLLETFGERFRRHWLSAMRGKLGLIAPDPEDESLIEELLRWMHATRADYTHTFRNLRPVSAPESAAHPNPTLAAWHRRWIARLTRQPQSTGEVSQLMNTRNPVVIPRNHEVEAALTAATARNDLAPLGKLLASIAKPYDDAGQPDALKNPPPSGTPKCQTFCGT